MENVSALLPLVKDLLSGFYNGSDIKSRNTWNAVPALTLFLEQVAQGGDKVKSTFKLTIGPDKVLAGEEPLAPLNTVKAANGNLSSTCCDGALEETETDSPILGPTKSPNNLNNGEGREEAVNPVRRLSVSSTGCENTMERTETYSPVLVQVEQPSVLKLVPNLLFSSPSKTFSSQKSAEEISAIFRQDEDTTLSSFDGIANTSAISSPSFLASESPGSSAGAFGNSPETFTVPLKSHPLNAAHLPTMAGARYIAHRLRSRSSPRLLPTPLRPNEPSSRISMRKSLQIAIDTVNALDAGSAQQESLHSLDFQGYNGEAKHLSINELTAMKGAGILHLLANDRTGSYKSKLQHILAKGVRKQHRNALDLAGKVPFSLMMKRIGVDSDQLWVDSAQAGGLYDTADAFLPQKIAYVEIKGARLKAGTKNQYLMKAIRHLGTDWDFLVFVCRSSQPADWLDPAEYDRCGFWLGVISREDYMAALKGTKLENKSEIDVVVTPGSGLASGGKKSKSWIGNFISWRRSTNVTPAWYHDTFCK